MSLQRGAMNTALPDFYRRLRGHAGDALESVSRGKLIRSVHAGRFYEQSLLRAFFEQFEIDAVFDVGANCGQYAQRLRQAVGYDGLIFSFEPLPELVTVLRAASAADTKWHAFDVALSDAEGRAEFNRARGTEFSSLYKPAPTVVDVVDKWNRVVDVIDVPLRQLDSYFDNLRREHGFRNPFLKMDTQGNDLAVFRGAATTHKYLAGIQSEMAVDVIYTGAPRFTETLQVYEQAGFKLSGMCPNNEGHFPDLVEFDCVMYNTRRTF